MQRFRAMDGNRSCAVFLFNLSPLYHIYIVKSLFTSRDHQLENLGENIVLACEMFTSGCRPWLKNSACLSSLLSNCLRIRKKVKFRLPHCDNVRAQCVTQTLCANFSHCFRINEQISSYCQYLPLQFSYLSCRQGN